MTDELPASASTVPPQVLVAFGVDATKTPVGRLSTSGAFKLATVSLALFNVRVRIEIPPAVIVAGLNAFPTVGGIEVTGGAAHAAKDTLLVSIVTAPFCASTLPETVVLVKRLMLVHAR